jgi:hypothetical protein
LQQELPDCGCSHVSATTHSMASPHSMGFILELCTPCKPFKVRAADGSAKGCREQLAGSHSRKASNDKWGGAPLYKHTFGPVQCALVHMIICYILQPSKNVSEPAAVTMRHLLLAVVLRTLPPSLPQQRRVVHILQRSAALLAAVIDRLASRQAALAASCIRPCWLHL